MRTPPYIHNVDNAIVAIHSVGGTFISLEKTFHVAADALQLRAKATHPDLKDACYGSANTATEALRQLVNELYSQLPDAN